MPDFSKVRKAQAGGTGCLVVLFFIFALAGVGMFYLMTLRPVLLMIEARSWEPVACAIDPSYRGDTPYSFRYQGLLYQVARYDFGDGSGFGGVRKARIVVGDRARSETTCYFDPDNPSRSVLDRTPGLFLLKGLFSVPFLAVGWWGLLALSRSSRWGKTRASAAALSGKHGAGGQKLELKATIPPTLIGGFFGTAVVWLFAIIFFYLNIFIGIGCVILALWAGHSTAELYRAFSSLRPRVVLESTHLELGTVSQAHWRLVGRVEHVRSFNIRFEGREVATYRRGTDSKTDRRVFHSELLVCETGPALRDEGVLTLRIPEHTVPSFDAPNNKIEWLLVVSGETAYPKTPEVELPITVRPPEGGKPSEETRR